jgi:RNA polymerase sigma-70 factor (ECF subfamily)
MADDAQEGSKKLPAAATARIVKFGARWKISEQSVRETLQRSVISWGGLARGDSIEAYLESLRAEDLALAIACRASVSDAWVTFIEKYRPVLYAAARTICRDEMLAREIADSMWAELYGVNARGAPRRSLLDYFHGRSSLATWLRAIVAQRHIDSIRSARRFEPLENAEAQRTRTSPEAPGAMEPDHARMMQIFAAVLGAAIAALASQDRLRLGYYYRDELTLRQIARLVNEHESTVSRKLERTRRDLRKNVERELTRTHRMSVEQIQLCYDHAAEDSPFKFNAEPTAQKKEAGSF